MAVHRVRRSVGARGAALAVVLLAAACGGSSAQGGHGANPGGTGGSSGSVGAASADSGVTPGGELDASAASADAGSAPGEFRAPPAAQTQQAAGLFSEGSAAYARGDFPAAARLFRQSYDLFPSPEMGYNLARVYERMGEVTEAVTFFERVLAANPEPAQRTEIQGRIEALRAYERRRREGIAQAPASTSALNQEGLTWFQRGVRLFQRRQYSQAMMAFEQAYQYSHTPELFYNMAMTHERLRHTAQAIEFFREYLNMRRGTPEEAEIESHIRELESHR